MRLSGLFILVVCCVALLSQVPFGPGFEAKLEAQESVCRAALMPDLTTLKSNTALRLAWLKTIDVSRFRQERTNVDTGGSVLVYGYPISGYADYSQFSDARDREFQNYRFDYSLDQSIDYVESKLSGAALDAFVKCLEIEARKQPNIHVWPKRIADDAIDVAILWNVPGKAVSFTTRDVQLTGAAMPAGFLPRTLQSSGYYEQHFQRIPGTDFNLILSTSGSYSDSLYVSKPIVLPPATVEKPKVCMPPASESDLGYPNTRQVLDIDGDGCSDYCRVVGKNSAYEMLCNFGTREGDTVRPKAVSAFSGGLGYAGSNHWVDYDLNGVIDHCRTVGNGPYEIWCQGLSRDGRLGSVVTIWRGADKGYDNGSRWVDMNGDGIPDWCRLVGGNPPVERCLINDRKHLTNEIAGR